jgi:hypothetical protein
MDIDQYIGIALPFFSDSSPVFHLIGEKEDRWRILFISHFTSFCRSRNWSPTGHRVGAIGRWSATN